jgi:NTE family protein
MGEERDEVIDLREGSTGERVAFVLAGGATRGAIQVGMLRALLERDIRPDLVVGTSVGAMNAAALAADATLAGVDRLDHDWCVARAGQIFPFELGAVVASLRGRRDHVLSNEGLRDWIDQHLDHDRLEDYPIPVHVVATVAETGRPIRLSRGDALTALLASTAIPGVFPPVTVEGRALHDGGVAADVPLPQALELGPSTVYVLPTTGEGPPPRSPWALLDRIFGNRVDPPSSPEQAQEQEQEQEMTGPDVTVHWLPAPPFGGNPYSFRASRRLIDEAHRLATDHLDRVVGSVQASKAKNITWVA